MKVRTHTAGLIGWLFGDQDRYEDVPDSQVDISLASCSAFVGAPCTIRRPGGAIEHGYVDTGSSFNPSRVIDIDLGDRDKSDYSKTSGGKK